VCRELGTVGRKPANKQGNTVQYYIITEVGIPILRIQMTQSINADMQRSMSSKIGHGHQTYTVDPCQYDSNLNIATKNTLWIYVLKTQI
jgi:hypothetical protein